MDAPDNEVDVALAEAECKLDPFVIERSIELKGIVRCIAQRKCPRGIR